MTGQVSGNLKCKRAEVTIATLNTTGRVAASSTASSSSGASETISTPTTPTLKKRFRLELQQTYQSCHDCGFFFNSAELIVEHSAGTLKRSRGGPFWVRNQYDLHGIINFDISQIPSNATINKATLWMVFHEQKGIANADSTSVVTSYGWINGEKLVVKKESAKDIKARGCNKVNNNCPFDYTSYAKRIHSS